ncbi:hypothetical protein M2139_000698 [Enterococcus sp. PF1-24]|uniref:DUF1827 family protein n=1 Tax=unclassified Enterococcus TaxID=2608891 RepID=UPI002473623C|nr:MULTISPECIES: DUF1827 family protein [unclassified Enterococcus]MDH6363581.1 hypothetical protein [Enterococcus sp. PFB1-1]MDH6400816.1 hypothetical protein [Enterococcus sp. PF1-24]
MKLIKSPLNTTVALRHVYPIICSYLFRDIQINTYEIYTLDRTTILKVDTFDAEVLVLFNKNRKIRKNEVDFICQQLLADEKNEQYVYLENVLEKMAAEGLFFSAKDFIVVQKNKVAV